MLLIGLAGKARVGKDTAGDFLEREYGLKRYAFAQPIKKAVEVMFSLSPMFLEGELKEQDLDTLGRSPRYLMQTLGTEWGRKMVHPDVWLKAGEMWLENQVLACDLADVPFHGAVITDVRFENEAQWIREHGGVVLHIYRDDAIQVNEHVSEAGVQLQGDVDYMIENNGTVEQFHQILWSVVDGIKAVA